MPMVFKTIIIVAALVCATLVDPEGAKDLIKKVLDGVVSHGKILPKKQPKNPSSKSLSGLELHSNDIDCDEYLSDFAEF